MSRLARVLDTQAGGAQENRGQSYNVVPNNVRTGSRLQWGQDVTGVLTKAL